jgi:hypothetical protein
MAHRFLRMNAMRDILCDIAVFLFCFIFFYKEWNLKFYSPGESFLWMDDLKRVCFHTWSPIHNNTLFRSLQLMAAYMKPEILHEHILPYVRKRLLSNDLFHGVVSSETHLTRTSRYCRASKGNSWTSRAWETRMKLQTGQAQILNVLPCFYPLFVQKCVQ